MNEQTAPAQSRSNSKKIRTAAIIATVLLLLAALFFAAVDFSPARQVPMTADKNEQVAWSKFMSKIFISLYQSKKAKTAECTFVFNEDELNAALNIILRNYELNRKANQAICYAQARSGIIELDASIKKAGMYLNIHLSVIPRIQDGKVTVKVKSAQLGMIPLPVSRIEPAIAEAVKEELSKPQMAAMIKLIRSAGFTAENQFKLVADSRAVKGMF